MTPKIQEADEEMEESVHHSDHSFLGERLVSPSDSGEDEPSEMDAVNEVEHGTLVVRDESEEEEEDDDDMELEMAGAFPGDLEAAKSALTPGKTAFNVSGDWAEELQRTISPMKQDREALRKTQAFVGEDLEDDEEQTPTAKLSVKGKGSSMATHMDLMDSLWGQEQLRISGCQAKPIAKGNGLKV